MRAAILNGASTPATLNEGGGSVSDLIQTTNDPALWGSEALGPSTRSPSFDAEKLIGWVETGAEIQKANKIATGGVDFGQLAAQMAAGAAAGASIAGVGAILGAVFGAVIFLVNNWDELFNSVPPQWQGAAEGVHDWFTNYGPEEFLAWVRSTRPDLLQTDPGELTRALLLFWLERYGVVITDAPGRSFYSGVPDHVYYTMAGGRDALVRLYTPFGIDYPRTRLEAHPAGTVSADGVSEGLGGVWQLSRKIYAPPVGTTDTASKPDQKGGAFGWILGGAALVAAAVAVSNSNHKTRR